MYCCTNGAKVNEVISHLLFPLALEFYLLMKIVVIVWKFMLLLFHLHLRENVKLRNLVKINLHKKFLQVLGL